jgi:hypothetical protein
LSVRLLEPEELPEVLDDAEAFYEEHCPNATPFNREKFLNYWQPLLMLGNGLIFIESEYGHDRATFGCVHTCNHFTGEPEYYGAFTAVRPAYRGGQVVLILLEGVMNFLRQLGAPCRLSISSSNPRTEVIWRRLGFEAETVRFVRRVE